MADDFELTKPQSVTRKTGRAFGHLVSEETRAKISASKKGQRSSRETEIKAGQHLSPGTQFKGTAQIITHVCEQCGDSFLRPDWNKNQNKFCSRECWKHSLNPPEPKICPACKTEFLIGGRGNKPRASVFCSDACKYLCRFRDGAKGSVLSDIDAAHLAGLVEGEGSIILHLHRDVANVRISIANTNLVLLRKIKQVVGIGSIVEKSSKNSKHKDSAWWQANADAAEFILKQIRPFMWMKTEQCDLAIETRERLRNPALKADRTWQLQYTERMRALNARGRRIPVQDGLFADELPAPLTASATT
jgi:hypothetical protein